MTERQQVTMGPFGCLIVAAFIGVAVGLGIAMGVLVYRLLT